MGRRYRIEPDANPIGEAMRAIRKKRRMSSGDVARAMGMPVRSYEHLETGTGRVTYERIVAFAQATESDAIAILLSPAFGSPDLAIRCADNKMMTIMLLAMKDLNEDLATDISLLEVNALVGGFTRLAKDLARHVRDRDTFAEEWLKQGSSKLAPALGKLRPVSP